MAPQSSNIDEDALRAFRLIAREYGAMTSEQADAQVLDGHWIEICQAALTSDLEQR